MSNNVLYSIVGVDLGKIRVGLATVDPSTHRAVPWRTIKRSKAEEEILSLIATGVKKLIVGLPLSSEDKNSRESEGVGRFCRRIQRRAIVEIVFVDEFLSSIEARERLGFSIKPHRQERNSGKVDAVAASIILQSYLDRC